MEIRTYDSFEAMQADMSREQKAANDSLNGAQREMRDDFEHERYWIKKSEYGFLIFGQAWSQNGHRDAVAKSLPDGPVDLDSEDLDECLWEMAGYAENRMAGYLAGRAFSEVVPNGELGDTHVSTCMPITLAAFEEAREANWRIDADVTPTLIEECIAIEAYVLMVQKGLVD